MKKLLLIMMTALLIAECSALPFTIEIGESETIDGAWSINIIPTETASSSSTTFNNGIWYNDSTTVYINTTNAPDHISVRTVNVTDNLQVDDDLFTNFIRDIDGFGVIFDQTILRVGADPLPIGGFGAVINRNTYINGNLNVTGGRVNVNETLTAHNITLSNGSLIYNRTAIGTNTLWELGMPLIESTIPGWESNTCWGERGFLMGTNPMICIKQSSGDILLYPKTGSTVRFGPMDINDLGVITGANNISMGISSSIIYAPTLDEDWWFQLNPATAPDSGFKFDYPNLKWKWETLGRAIQNQTFDLTSALGDETLEIINLKVHKITGTAGKHWTLPFDTILWLGDTDAYLYRSSDNSLQFGNNAGQFVINAETLVNSNLLIKDGQTIKTNLIESITDEAVTINDNLSVKGNITVNHIYVDGTKNFLSMRPQLYAGRIRSPSTPTFITYGVYAGYSLPESIPADDEDLFFREHIPGRKMNGTNISLAIDLAVIDAQTVGNNFTMNVTCSNTNMQSGSLVNAPTYGNNITQSILTGRDGAYSFYRLIVDVDGRAIYNGDVFSCRILRVEGLGTDITGEVMLIDVYLTYQVDKVFKEALI